MPAEAKREGDGATPAGVWRLTGIRVRRDRLSWPGAQPIGPRDGWAEHPDDPDYNRPIRHPHSYPADRMRRGDGLYDLVATLDHNTGPVVPGAGSAIFLHRWRKPRHPTAGCVAFRSRDLMFVLRRWTERSRVIIRG